MTRVEASLVVHDGPQSKIMDDKATAKVSILVDDFKSYGGIRTNIRGGRDILTVSISGYGHVVSGYGPVLTTTVHLSVTQQVSLKRSESSFLVSTLQNIAAVSLRRTSMGWRVTDGGGRKGHDDKYLRTDL